MGDDSYKAIATYVPVHGDEIKLNIGDRVTVLHSYDDGWILGRNLSSNSVGLLPRNFLIVDNSAGSRSPKSVPASTPMTAAERRSSMIVRQRAAAAAASGGNGGGDTPSILKQQLASLNPRSDASSINSASSPTIPTMSGYTTLNPNHMNNSSMSSGHGPGQGSNNKPDALMTKDIHSSNYQVKSETFPRSPKSSSIHSATGYGGPPLPVAKSVLEDTDFVPTTEDLRMIPIPEPSNNKLEEANKKYEMLSAKRKERAIPASNIGTFKISIVGDTGIGKTSLIKTFVSSKEFVDNVTENSLPGSIEMNEYLSSTVPESDIHYGEDKSNITFIDTPGYGSSMDALDVIRPVLEYHQYQFLSTDSVFVPDAPQKLLMKFLKSSAGAHSHVDICIYGILHRLTQVDLEYMRKLSTYVNVVPVLLKCDTLSKDELFNLKTTVLKKLIQAKIPICGFGMSLEECFQLANGQIGGAPPFAFASSDALSKGIRPGSGESEFEVLKNKILFEFIGDLRALTAEKFCQWRLRQQGRNAAAVNASANNKK